MHPQRMNCATPNARSTPHSVLIQGTNAAGTVVWYTGKSGSAFVSHRHDDAFMGFDAHGARLKAESLNRTSTFHGYHFSPFAVRAAYARWTDKHDGYLVPRCEVLRILRGCRDKGWPYRLERTGPHRFRITHGASAALLIATDGMPL